ncbi:MAG: hypothetical protein QM705_11135 [Ancrocorticia sp.]
MSGEAARDATDGVASKLILDVGLLREKEPGEFVCILHGFLASIVLALGWCGASGV